MMTHIMFLSYMNIYWNIRAQHLIIFLIREISWIINGPTFHKHVEYSINFSASKEVNRIRKDTKYFYIFSTIIVDVIISTLQTNTASQ